VRGYGIEQRCRGAVRIPPAQRLAHYKRIRVSLVTLGVVARPSAKMDMVREGLVASGGVGPRGNSHPRVHKSRHRALVCTPALF
jgi:hypothetical protein